MFFNNKCKCECEYNTVRTLRNANDYAESVHRSIFDLLIEAGVLVETDSKVGLIKYYDKKYKVKKIK